jgi:predicted exporter
LVSERLALRAFLVLFGAVLLLGAWQWRGAPPISANLLELIPNQTPSLLEQQAVARIEEPLNREMLILVGHHDRDTAIDMVAALQRQWATHPIFDRVQWQFQGDLGPLRQQLLAGRLAYLPASDAQQLETDPQAYIRARAGELINPFGSGGPVAAQDDWLGLTSRILKSLPNATRMQADLGSGALMTEYDGQYWALLRAHTRVDAFDLTVPQQAAQLVAQARKEIAARHGQLLAAGGMLHAAAAGDQARKEISLMGTLATVGSLMLLLGSFRRWRSVMVLIPVGVGVTSGIVVCVAVFGKIHVLTLVLGVSLTGVAIDYAMHYLSKSFTLRPWNIRRALHLVLPGLTLSMITSSLGYLTLAWAPFPALRQIATFSIAGLVGSYLCAVCLLPTLLKNFTPPARSGMLTFARFLIRKQRRVRFARSYLTLAVLLAAGLGGIVLLKSQDDLRQWVMPSQQLLQEAERISAITGYQPTSQFFMITAATEDELLARQAALSKRLDIARSAGQLQGYLGLSQLLAPVARQKELAAALAKLPSGAIWAPLTALGIPEEAIHKEIARLGALPPISPQQALAGPLGEIWRPLSLPASANGFVGLVSLQGRANSGQLSALADGLPGVTLVDHLGALTTLFATTRQSASWLMGLACLVMGSLLCLHFGWRHGLHILAVPVTSIVMTLGVLGYAGQPLTLFVLFGLILVLTIGVDYAIFMFESIAGRSTTLAGVILDAGTTLLSFGLLALSHTPAVRSFGLSVGLGITFCFLLAPWTGQHVARRPAAKAGLAPHPT